MNNTEQSVIVKGTLTGTRFSVFRDSDEIQVVGTGHRRTIGWIENKWQKSTDYTEIAMLTQWMEAYMAGKAQLDAMGAVC